ncbi:MAG: virulence RhuM family protein [Gammaproteobacteria bacterium]|nr:virulence RhuM family protein [Gammaproteobacteria bacterium]MXW46772.1 virulence RhuM family protein [Gammaproteobacteria bacterium]MYD03256.1 virulence RhuM family protein [Gammaproteobacteria bacterium]MYI24208.1 virulence RhuM family protein [Gammaproteobacteria bacterium]
MSGQNQAKPGGELLMYPTSKEATPIRVLLEGETVWLTQRLIADLYNTSVPNISQHIKAIYKQGELQPEATLKKYLIVQLEGEREVKRLVEHYNLEMIIAVGYRVRSTRGTQFRQWATERLSEYLVKGFTLDDERLKGTSSTIDYFDELLARIRDIRASEARVYQRIRDTFALASDYHEGERETRLFFATMQNKMHFAATGLTAAEIIHKRADAGKPNMGATNWKGRRVLKRDVGTAKNYLDHREIDTLNRITVMFLDQAEFRAGRRQDIRMSDWENFLDKFLTGTELPILEGAGHISHQDALDHANRQYAAFAERRRTALEAKADARYVDDLKSSARLLGNARKQAGKKTGGGRENGRGRT